MAMTQDELGNWYDDGFGSDSFHDFTGMSEGGAENVFDPTYGGQLALPAGSNTRSLGVGGANAMPSIDADFSPTYPITGGGIGGRSVVGNTGGIANYLKSLDLTTAGGIAGALAGATGAFTNKPKKAYEGSIPQLQAVRNMVLAPPTANYRPGQGGVNYNADVYYAPAGTVPASMTGTMTPAAQVAAANAARAITTPPKAITTPPKSNSTLSNLAKVAGGAGIASLLNNVLSGKGGSNVAGAGGKTLTGLVDAGGRLTTAGINAITNALKTATAGGAPAGSRPGGVTPKGGGSPTGGAGAPSTTGNVAADDGTTEDIQKTIDEMNASPYNADGTLKEGYELDEDNNPVLSGDNTLTVYNPDGSSSIIGRNAEQVLSDEEIQAEYDRLAAERDAEIAALEAEAEAEAAANENVGLSRSMGGGNAAGTTDDYYDWMNDASTTDSRGYESLYSGFDFGSNDLNLDGFDLGDYGYDGIDYGEYFAKGGEINMAKGRYLQGNTDGMADKIPARIGKKQPAALSHGEFVVPADVVSHLGNGNSDAGAKKLYEMMDRIRVARTGNKKQGKQINPDKFMPGGLAQAYAEGGSVKRFVNGGTTGTSATGLGAAVNAGITGSETGPNSWAGDYMSNMLGKTQALTESPYQQYMGPLSAGASGLQNQVFTGLQNTTFPGNLGQSFSSQGAYAAPTMGANGMAASTPTTPTQPTGIASQYMNPYLQSVLDPQLAELRRQSQINLQPGLAKLTQAGGFGGGRQAIMESEANRNLLQEQNKTVGQGYASAYDKAQQQFNAEQAQGRSLADLMAQQGNVQRGIEAEGIAADKSAFEAARENPYKMLQFQQSMLQGMPISATSYNIAQPTKAQEIMAGAAGGAKAVGANNKTVADLLQQLGL
jgi:hypothetical protein